MEWKVYKTRIELYPHPNADKLQLAKVGDYQLVVKSGLYEDGQIVVFAPEKSILPDIYAEDFRNYLVGPNSDRVRAANIRDQISMGVVLPPHKLPEWVDEIPLGEDISERLGIIKYEAPIPEDLVGKVDRFEARVSKFDLGPLATNLKLFRPGMNVVVTEKVHGSQVNLIRNGEGQYFLTTKGFVNSGISINEDPTNPYWKGVYNTNLIKLMDECFPNGEAVQLVGELLPIEGHGQYQYGIGADEPRVYVFDISVNGVPLAFDEIPEPFKSVWVPVLYRGPLEMDEKEMVLYENPEQGIRKTKSVYSLGKKMDNLRKGLETLSGKGLHPREGCVFRPVTHDKGIRFKHINPDYKETGEEIS